MVATHPSIALAANELAWMYREAVHPSGTKQAFAQGHATLVRARIPGRNVVDAMAVGAHRAAWWAPCGCSAETSCMYISACSCSLLRVSELTVTDARARLADVVDEARVTRDPVFLTRRGRRVAAVIDADQLEKLFEAAEDLADIQVAAAARAEMAESGEEPVPWEQVKADLGLV
jgi:prevent-host-death family protein